MNLQEFIDANPWLDKCKKDYCEYQPSFMWDGLDCYTDSSASITFTLSEEGFIERVEFILSEEAMFFMEEIGFEFIKKHFLNWKAPTKQENEMFAMLHGHPLPWSEEQPFVWEE